LILLVFGISIELNILQYILNIEKKKCTKIASLVDSDGDIISIVNFIINESIEANNDYEYVKKTFSHDVKIIQELFDNVIIPFDKRKKIISIGDKAFKTKENIVINKLKK